MKYTVDKKIIIIWITRHDARGRAARRETTRGSDNTLWYMVQLWTRRIGFALTTDSPLAAINFFFFFFQNNNFNSILWNKHNNYYSLLVWHDLDLLLFVMVLVQLMSFFSVFNIYFKKNKLLKMDQNWIKNWINK